MALSLFNNMELCGRGMKIARPAGYVEPAQPLAGLLPMSSAPGMVGGGLPAPPPQPPMVGVPSQTSVSPPEPTSKSLPSYTLCLHNLMSEAVLNDDSEFQDYVADIREECESFGKIAAFVIPRKGDLQGRSEDDVGKVFVKFESIVAASKAHDSLDKRDFDGNTVKAEYLPAGSM